MAKIIDLIVFGITYFLVVFGFLSKLVDKWLAIALAIVTYFSFVVLVSIGFHRRKMRKTITVDEMPVYLALMERDKQTELFYNLVPEDKRKEIKSPYFTFYEEESLTLVAVLYRFINLTQEDIASAYREGVRQGASKIIMLTRARERKTIALTALLPIPFQFPDKWNVFRQLKKHNSLPAKPPKREKVKIKRTKREIYELVFDEKKRKYFMLTSLFLALTSLFTPLKTYYLIMASIPLILGLGTMVKKNWE